MFPGKHLEPGFDFKANYVTIMLDILENEGGFCLKILKKDILLRRLAEESAQPIRLILQLEAMNLILSVQLNQPQSQRSIISVLDGA